MDQVRFTDGQVPLTTDLNRIHEFTEAGFADLLRATADGSPGKLLFSAVPPTVSLNGSDLQVDITSQWFAVSGAIQSVATDQKLFDVSGGGDLRVDVYFVGSKSSVLEVRDVVSIDPTTSARILDQALNTQTHVTDAARVEYQITTDLLTVPAAPALQANDVDYVLLASIAFTGATSSIAITENTADQWTLPASVVGGLSTHGSTHLTGGSDPIPEATTLSSGILPAGAIDLVTGAVQSVSVDPGSAYLVAVDASNAVNLTMNLFDSLEVTDDGGTLKLAVSHLPSSTVNGTSDKSARADHIHTAQQSGVLIQETILDLSVLTLGGTIDLTFEPVIIGGSNVSPSKITDVSFRWLPPSLIDETNPNGIDASWVSVWDSGANRTAGARAFVTGTNTFTVELGELGATTLTPAAKTALSSWVSIPYSGADYPTTGKLQIIAQGIIQ